VVTATILTLMAGLAGCAFVFWQGQVRTEEQRRVAEDQSLRAEARSEMALQAFDEMYLQAERWINFEPFVAPEQQQFLNKALTFYEQLTQEKGKAAAERHRTAKALHRIAQINLRLAYTGHWSKEKAERSINDAIRLQSQLSAEDIQEPRYL